MAFIQGSSNHLYVGDQNLSTVGNNHYRLVYHQVFHPQLHRYRLSYRNQR